ncbi:MAG TPA: hypothetical protein VHV08_12910 [Pirellulales bacterium]|jgi:hypothetical protein|nr:hypothetical protein [Pirellulales bacterium]
MNQRFARKIVYALAIAALLLPLSWLSQPATTESDGGLLSRMRKQYQLGQASLGEIDPASETIKLATLGMRGVAVNILWEKANYYRKTEDWANLSATLEQIVKLQPNFVSVWIFQGWNLSYNISVEFDDYRDRYYWVIKGIEFLKEGITYNTREPRLLSEIGETIGRKIGTADERVQFRRLFREDDDFNGPRPLAQRDNWLVGREWLLSAQQLVEQGAPLRGKSPLLFYAQAPMCLINYSEAIEEDGTFGEVGRAGWKKAADSWTQYSQRDLPTQYGFAIRLGDKEIYDKRAQDARAELDRLTPEGLREKIQAEKLASLTSEEREINDMAPQERTKEHADALYGIQLKLAISPTEIADRVAPENHATALKAADEVTQSEFVARAIDTDRGIVNYDYWMLRCRVEPTDDAIDARKLIYDADHAFLAAQLVSSRDSYEQGWKKWRLVLDMNPMLLTDSTSTDELAESISHYRNVLHQLDEKFPEPFILQDVIDADVKFRGPRYTTSSGSVRPGSTTDSEKPAGEAPAAGDAQPPDAGGQKPSGDQPPEDKSQTQSAPSQPSASETPK